MSDDVERPHIELLDLNDERGFMERFTIPEHAVRRRRRTRKLVNDFLGVSSEFNRSDDEYLEFVNQLTRQDIALMTEYLRAEIRIVQQQNGEAIRDLRELTPEKIWSGQ
jgi:hypothetical protein